MLAEQFTKFAQVLQCNTDGITIKVKRNLRNRVDEVVNWWQDLTGLELESVMYKSMIIRDINNYIAITTSGKVKYKGAFEIDKELKGEMQYHKDHSNRIVPLAVSLYFTDGIPVDKTIKEHLTAGHYYKDKVKNYGIFDFCAMVRTKGGKKGTPKIVQRYVDNKGQIKQDKLQKINRFFISNKGVQLLKVYPNGSEEQIAAHPQKGRSYKAYLFNEYIEMDNYNIDYTYYIREANKLINSIVDFNYSLF